MASITSTQQMNDTLVTRDLQGATSTSTANAIPAHYGNTNQRPTVRTELKLIHFNHCASLLYKKCIQVFFCNKIKLCNRPQMAAFNMTNW